MADISGTTSPRRARRVATLRQEAARTLLAGAVGGLVGGALEGLFGLLDIKSLFHGVRPTSRRGQSLFRG